GYGEGSALLLRTHHAIADGVALVQVLLALTDPVDADEHVGALRVHDDTGRPLLAPSAAGRAAQRAAAAARRAASAARVLSAPLRHVLTDPGRSEERRVGKEGRS